MTAQDSYEYSTNTGAKLSVGGKSDEEETDPQEEHNPDNMCCTLTMTTEPKTRGGNSTVWLSGVKESRNSRLEKLSEITHNKLTSG